MRRYLYRTPQFGLLTLFAAMLLFVSGAGWFKFHYDLYREEEAVLAELSEAGFHVRVSRYHQVSAEGEPLYQH